MANIIYALQCTSGFALLPFPRYQSDGKVCQNADVTTFGLQASLLERNCGTNIKVDPLAITNANAATC
jgi:hypothetical protein